MPFFIAGVKTKKKSFFEKMSGILLRPGEESHSGMYFIKKEFSKGPVGLFKFRF